MSSDYNDVAEWALLHAQQTHPDAHPHRHSAFANCVAFLVAGGSAGYGGPTVREHVVSGIFTGGSFTCDQAVRELDDPDGLIWGPVNDAHREIWAESPEICHDDDPADVEALNA